MTMTRAIAAAGSLALLLIGPGRLGAAAFTESGVNKGVLELETLPTRLPGLLEASGRRR
jgi:hypothetical protein